LLSLAAGNGHKNVVETLLTKNVNLNSKDNDGRTPLSWAAGNGHIEIIRRLLTKDNIDLNSKDSDGQTPLGWAARKRA